MLCLETAQAGPNRAQGGEPVAPLDAGVAFERTAFATVHNGIADWRRDRGLALFVILNSLLDVAEALLRLPGNLF
jgi:hypothetical protein